MNPDVAAPRFFASASRGAEQALADELSEFGIEPIVLHRGGVGFGRGLEDGYRACLWSRLASRVLMPLAAFDAEDARALYAGVHAIDWTEHLGPERTIAVGVAGVQSPAGPSHFLALKAKDAIVDRVREAEGARPDVDKLHPDVRVHLHVRGARVTVSLDFAGRGLHRRGLGRTAGAAPLKENLAATLLRLAGWPGADPVPLFDPMCGAGTLLVEAAGIALDVAPGLGRGRLGPEGWRGHDTALERRLRSEAQDRRAAARDRPLRIAGADASPAAVRAARELVRHAGFAGKIRIELGELRDTAAPWADPGILVTNPPYGARLGEAGELGPLYEQLGDVLKRRFGGWTGWVFSGNRALDKRIGLRAASRRVLFNGPIECRLLEIPIDSARVESDRGPGWRRPAGEARGFARRLAANLRRMRRHAARERLTCFRLYDADVPEYNLAVDWYEGAVRVEEYERPPKVPAADADRRLQDAVRVVAEVLEVDPADVVLRVRRRLEPGEQHEPSGDRGRFREVREGDLVFRVNLLDYLDTGLFLDDRLLRRRIRERAAGRDFLNLFAYTCAATVAAAAGGARSTTSVDLSAAYLRWGRDQLVLNAQAGEQHRFVREDVARFLQTGRDARSYGLIFVAPPTHSRSKAMSGDFSVQRDHAGLLAQAARRLTADGEILFSTHRREFALDTAALHGLEIEELSEALTPPDFARRPRLRVWRLTPRQVRKSKPG